MAHLFLTRWNFLHKKIYDKTKILELFLQVLKCSNFSSTTPVTLLNLWKRNLRQGPGGESRFQRRTGKGLDCVLSSASPWWGKRKSDKTENNLTVTLPLILRNSNGPQRNFLTSDSHSFEILGVFFLVEVLSNYLKDHTWIFVPNY